MSVALEVERGKNRVTIMGVFLDSDWSMELLWRVVSYYLIIP